MSRVSAAVLLFWSSTKDSNIYKHQSFQPLQPLPNCCFLLFTDINTSTFYRLIESFEYKKSSNLPQLLFTLNLPDLPFIYTDRELKALTAAVLRIWLTKRKLQTLNRRPGRKKYKWPCTLEQAFIVERRGNKWFKTTITKKKLLFNVRNLKSIKPIKTLNVVYYLPLFCQNSLQLINNMNKNMVWCHSRWLFSHFKHILLN